MRLHDHLRARHKGTSRRIVEEPGVRDAGSQCLASSLSCGLVLDATPLLLTPSAGNTSDNFHIRKSLVIKLQTRISPFGDTVKQSTLAPVSSCAISRNPQIPKTNRTVLGT